MLYKEKETSPSSPTIGHLHDHITKDFTSVLLGPRGSRLKPTIDISEDLRVKSVTISGFQALRQARGVSGGARTFDKRVPADLKACSLSTAHQFPTPPLPSA
ncbi:hypothetical protein PoB_001428200 [Plakobranchus ocellatus]|uniref:Uncharacterized protein n=1 Tax=Plakobranchus ocellatus TaxID=259542 RepID=A0AAV3YZQ3_9GAST|nr:hypothetical protein PoB_001428200 [Plakobranchus ocellatus]